jgi:GNAT superfamily N-acetyltransferase
MSFIVQQCGTDGLSADLQRLFIDWAAEEDWLPCPKDLSYFLAPDPQGFFIGYLVHGDGPKHPVCCIAACRFPSGSNSAQTAMTYTDWAFIHYFICHSEHRRHGYGRRIFDAAMQYLNECTVIGLDAVASQVPFYQRHGFQQYWINYYFTGTMQSIVECGIEFVGSTTSPRIYQSVDFNALIEYDRLLYGGCDRSQFLRSILYDCGGGGGGDDDANCVVAYDINNVRLTGYAIIRRCVSDGQTQQWRLGPWQADSGAVALSLLRCVGGHYNDSDGEISCDVPGCNSQAVALVRATLGWQIAGETVRMYRSSTPVNSVLRTEHLYAVLLEMG